MAGPMPPQGAPQGAGPQAGGGGNPIAAGLHTTMQGLQMIGGGLKSAGSSVPPAFVQAFQAAMKGVQGMVQAASQPAPQQGQPPAPQPQGGSAPQPGGPMPGNAGPNSQPLPQG